MTEYEVFKQALERVWHSENKKCKVLIEENSLTLTSYFGHLFETFLFDNDGNLIEIDCD